MEESNNSDRKKSMPSRIRKEEKKLRILEDKKLRIREAIKQGLRLKKEIAAAASLTIAVLNNVFAEDRKLYAEYRVSLKTIADIAVDNLHEAVMNIDHPKNIEISKWIATKYKTELDEALDSVEEGDSMSIDVHGESGGGVTIIWGDNSSNSRDEE